ncbi:hypothetical protein Golob_009037 [Gossypium lobatum]|uniref:Uncharacterized protein n=1 Tax=Gossypium lobatum TaxID=34289 RepID=A0A7J8MH80_9ROSI|nr:hypothetical protein [Gossypium lobatum]
MTLIGFDFADVQTAIAAKETCIEQLMIPSQPSAGCGASAVPAARVAYHHQLRLALLLDPIVSS